MPPWNGDIRLPSSKVAGHLNVVYTQVQTAAYTGKGFMILTEVFRRLKVGYYTSEILHALYTEYYPLNTLSFCYVSHVVNTNTARFVERLYLSNGYPLDTSCGANKNEVTKIREWQYETPEYKALLGTRHIQQLHTPEKSFMVLTEVFRRLKVGYYTSEVLHALYTEYYPLNTPSFCFFTCIINPNTAKFIERLYIAKGYPLDTSRGDDVGEVIQTREWEYGTPEYKALLGTRDIQQLHTPEKVSWL